MRTKELIIAELLQAGHLKAEDAAILLTPIYVYTYLDSPKWITPYNPPYWITCHDTVTTNSITFN